MKSEVPTWRVTCVVCDTQYFAIILCLCVKYYHFALTICCCCCGCCCCCCCCCCWAMLYLCPDSTLACCKTQLALYSLGGCDVISHEQGQGEELWNRRFEYFEWIVLLRVPAKTSSPSPQFVKKRKIFSKTKNEETKSSVNIKINVDFWVWLASSCLPVRT